VWFFPKDSKLYNNRNRHWLAIKSSNQVSIIVNWVELKKWFGSQNGAAEI